MYCYKVVLFFLAFLPPLHASQEPLVTLSSGIMTITQNGCHYFYPVQIATLTSAINSSNTQQPSYQKAERSWIQHKTRQANPYAQLKNPQKSANQGTHTHEFFNRKRIKDRTDTFKTKIARTEINQADSDDSSWREEIEGKFKKLSIAITQIKYAPVAITSVHNSEQTTSNSSSSVLENSSNTHPLKRSPDMENIAEHTSKSKKQRASQQSQSGLPPRHPLKKSQALQSLTQLKQGQSNNS